MRTFSPLVVLLTLFAAAAGPTFARASEQDDARRALERGEIRPLEQVLQAARKAVPGEVVKVELDRDDGLWVYEIKLLTADGERREVEIDASSLRILEVD